MEWQWRIMNFANYNTYTASNNNKNAITFKKYPLNNYFVIIKIKENYYLNLLVMVWFGNEWTSSFIRYQPFWLCHRQRLYRLQRKSYGNCLSLHWLRNFLPEHDTPKWGHRKYCVKLRCIRNRCLGWGVTTVWPEKTHPTFNPSTTWSFDVSHLVIAHSLFVIYITQSLFL